MLINLIGPLTIHPYIDRTSLSFLTRDTRPEGLVTQIYDGLVYEQEGSDARQLLIGEFQQVQDGFIRTSVPLLRTRGRRYYCGHVWHHDNEEAKRRRLTKVHVEQDLVLITPGDDTPQIVVDIGIEMDFEPHNLTLWDVLTE